MEDSFCGFLFFIFTDWPLHCSLQRPSPSSILRSMDLLTINCTAERRVNWTARVKCHYNETTQWNENCFQSQTIKTTKTASQQTTFVVVVPDMNNRAIICAAEYHNTSIHSGDPGLLTFATNIPILLPNWTSDLIEISADYYTQAPSEQFTTSGLESSHQGFSSWPTQTVSSQLC